MKLPITINPQRGIAIVLLAVVMPLSFLFSCVREKKEMVEIVFNPQTTPTLKQKSLETLLSDSGITKVKLTTETYLVFGKASEPYWLFPDGIYVEKYDSLFNVEFSIKADTAYFYERQDLWECIGNVDITNVNDERFQTEQIFWNRKNKTIYSNVFIKMTKGETVQKGVGFISNDDMSKWTIRQSDTDMPVELKRRSAATQPAPVNSFIKE